MQVADELISKNDGLDTLRRTPWSRAEQPVAVGIKHGDAWRNGQRVRRNEIAVDAGGRPP